MRPIPAPRRADAIAMPEGDSRDWVVHPGDEPPERFKLSRCCARKIEAVLPKGAILLDAVASIVEVEGADGACAILDGVSLSKMHYVMPDGPADEIHAAWYSDTYVTEDVTLDWAISSVGLKDDAWFLHTHAIWESGGTQVGHLLNDHCVLATDCSVTIWLISGVRLEVALDPETQFPLFGPNELYAVEEPNAALLTIKPHEDLRKTLEMACEKAGISRAKVFGLGSLIGAGFLDAPPMHSTISEVVLLEGCSVEKGRCTALPLICVDPAGKTYSGDLAYGNGPVLVTFELLLINAS